jgi:hypothetical protein
MPINSVFINLDTQTGQPEITSIEDPESGLVPGSAETVLAIYKKIRDSDCPDFEFVFKAAVQAVFGPLNW